jgi:hypothetical protein
MDSNGPKNYLFERFPTQIIAFVVIEFSYLRFSCHFRPRPESATSLFATMISSVRLCALKGNENTHLASFF